MPVSSKVFLLFCYSTVLLYVRPSVRSSIRPSVRLSVRMSVRTYVRPSVRPSVRSSVRPSSVRPSLRTYVRPSIRLSVRPSVRPYVRPPVVPSVHPFVRPSGRPTAGRPTRHENDVSQFTHSFIRDGRNERRPTLRLTKPYIDSIVYTSITVLSPILLSGDRNLRRGVNRFENRKKASNTKLFVIVSIQADVQFGPKFTAL